MRELTSAICIWCAKPFDYVRVTKRKEVCSPICSNARFRHREEQKLQAIRSGTLNPRAPLSRGNGIAIEQGVLLPPSAIPANDFAWALEPPLPKQSWVFEVNGAFFHRLAQAEAYAQGHLPEVAIYCRPAAEKVAVNQ